MQLINRAADEAVERSVHPRRRAGSAGNMGQQLFSGLLDLAEQQVAASEQQVMRQRQIVAKLRALGADTWGAQALLNDFQDIRRLHARNRDRLKRLLDNARRPR